MSSPFVVRRHIFLGQHIREYPRALATHQEDALIIATNSYTPHEVDNGSVEGQLTIIAFHADASTKEVYEPFLETLYCVLKSRYGLTIGSIWFPDQAAQGDSAVLNDEILANDSHYFDHSRHIMQIVNTFRKHMKRPIVALAHSMSGAQAVAAATYLPRLFEAIVLNRYGNNHDGIRKPGLPIPLRPPYIESTFHDAPTVLYPNRTTKPKTTAFAEMRNTAHPNLDNVTIDEPLTEEQRYDFPDIITEAPMKWLPSLRPPTLYILAKNSVICPPSELEHRTNITGTGHGGSGGVEAGNMKAVTIDRDHFLPMTDIEKTAGVVGEWLVERIRKWQVLKERIEREWKGKSTAEKQRPEQRVVERLRKWDGMAARNPNALGDGGRSKI